QCRWQLFADARDASRSSGGGRRDERKVLPAPFAGELNCVRKQDSSASVSLFHHSGDSGNLQSQRAIRCPDIRIPADAGMTETGSPIPQRPPTVCPSGKTTEVNIPPGRASKKGLPVTSTTSPGLRLERVKPIRTRN